MIYDNTIFDMLFDTIFDMILNLIINLVFFKFIKMLIANLLLIGVVCKPDIRIWHFYSILSGYLMILRYI